MAVELIDAHDDHFAWLLGEKEACGPLCHPPGGVDIAPVLIWLRQTTAGLRAARVRGWWLTADGKEVVGLGSYKCPPDSGGMAEIGYGAAASRRGRGNASHAVAAVIVRAR